MKNNVEQKYNANIYTLALELKEVFFQYFDRMSIELDEFIEILDDYRTGFNDAQFNLILKEFWGWDSFSNQYSGECEYYEEAYLKVIQGKYYLEAQLDNEESIGYYNVELFRRDYHFGMPSTSDVMAAIEAAVNMEEGLFYKIA